MLFQARLNNLLSRRNLSVTDAQTDLQNSSVTNSKSVFDPRFFFEQSLSEDAVEKLRRALLYRSRQTGWLETDVIMVRISSERSRIWIISSYVVKKTLIQRLMADKCLLDQGKWAEANLQRLSIDELRQYSDIVKV